jgi:hypothetical protein
VARVRNDAIHAFGNVQSILVHDSICFDFCKEKDFQTSIRFGHFIGLYAGAIQFGYYPALSLAFAWVTGSLTEGACLGMIVSKTYKN